METTVKYDYLFDKNNNLVHFTEGKKGERYKMYPEDTELVFNFKDYKDRTSHFSLLSNREHFGETPEHYNAKMKIKHELKYFDTIFNDYVYFDKVIAERKDADRKIPDLQCYQNNKLVCFIEIHFTNAKTDEDIENLKINNIPVIEINIKNENRCKHLILPTLLESNRQEYERIKEEIKKTIQKRDAIVELIPQVRNEIRDQQEFKQKTIRTNDFFRDGIREFTEAIERVRAGRLPESSIYSIKKEIKHFEGLIQWQKNRSRQASTICKRCF